MFGAEVSWQRGMFVSNVPEKSENLLQAANLSQESDAWDDTVILEIFDEAIRSHKTKQVR